MWNEYAVDGTVDDLLLEKVYVVEVVSNDYSGDEFLTLNDED